MSSYGRPSSSAAICRSTVSVPWPISPSPVITVARPSSLMRTIAELPSQSPKLRRPFTCRLHPMPKPWLGRLVLCLAFQSISCVALSMHCFNSQLVILWLCGDTSPGSTAFMCNKSAMGMPSFSAARSQACSTAQSADGLPKPRNAPVGTRLVYTSRECARAFGYL